MVANLSYCKERSHSKDIATIVGCNVATINWELRRNFMGKGNCQWYEVHAKAIFRCKWTTSNKKPDDILVWRIKELLGQYWSLEE